MERHAALLPSPGTGGRHTPFWLGEMHCARADEPSGWAWAGAGGLRRLAALLLTVWLSRAPAWPLGRLGVLVSWLAVGRRPRPAAEVCSLREANVAGGAGIPQAPEVWPQAHEGA